MTSDHDRRVFNDVVVPHLDDAWRFARWITGNAADAEDVVQEACVRVLTGAGTYAGGSKRAWLISIVRNTAFTWMARNRPKSVVLSGDQPDAPEQASSAPSPEAEVIARAGQALLTRAIAELPAPFREILILREINDLSYREISDTAGIPIGTVMSRLARARALLIERIGKDLT